MSNFFFKRLLFLENHDEGNAVNEKIQCFYLFSREKQEINWMIKLLRTPVIFFSNNYLCKSITGCAGSGVFKNTTVDVRNNIVQLMVDNGLLLNGHLVSGTKGESFVKVTPTNLRQKESAVHLFKKFGSVLTLKMYEKLYDTFGLITMSDGAIVTVTDEALNLLKHDDSFVNYYHCLDKDHRIAKMIEQRINAKEINLVRNFSNGPYRFEINETINEYGSHLSSDLSKNIANDHDENNDTVRTAESFQMMNCNEKLGFSNGHSSEPIHQNNMRLENQSPVTVNNVDVALSGKFLFVKLNSLKLNYFQRLNLSIHITRRYHACRLLNFTFFFLAP